MKQILLIFIGIILSGCGVVYQPSSVIVAASENIHLVQLTPKTVLEANRSPYRPQSWPVGLTSIKEIKAGDPIIDKFTEPALDPQLLSGSIKMRLPETLQPHVYIIGIGDVITLSTPVSNNLVEALNGLLASQNTRQEYMVQEDGAISIPELGRVIVGGLTPEEAEDALYQKLVAVGISPTLSIEVTGFNSQKVSIIGNVASPGTEPIGLQPLFLDQAIYNKGGIKINNAIFVVIRLYRNGAIYQISGPELYNQNGSNRLLLKDGDTIVVDTTDEYESILGLHQQARKNKLREFEVYSRGKAYQTQSVTSKLEFGSIQREYIYVIGEVQRQSRFVLPFESIAVLADALLESGGGLLSLSGNPNQIYVLRGARKLKDFTSITALHLDASNAANFLLATHLELRPKDVIFVGTQPITNWNRVISQIIPSLSLADMNIPTIN
tara:strand:- start:15385 stop:16701 length:1317 start_codon:yes stop_codon:yes gene_type:complete